MNWDVWGPPLVVLGLGLVGGAIVALRSRDGVKGVADRESRRQALVARKATLLEEIGLLDGDRGKLGEAEYKARREALIAQGAETLRGLEDVSAEAASASEPSAEPQVREAGSGAKRLAWGIGTVGFFVVLGVVMAQFTGDRAGGSMTGGGGGGGEGGGMQLSGKTAAQVSAEVASAREALAANPKDLAALNIVTYDALLTRNLQEAMQLLDRGRELAPTDADVLTHMAMLQISVGMGDRASEGLEQAIAAAPNRGKPWLWKAMLHINAQQPGPALEALQKALQFGLERQDEQQFAMQLVAEARSLSAGPGAGAPAMAGGGAASGGPPAAAGGGPVSTDVRLTGTLSAADAASLPTGGQLFIIVRSAPGARPPLAAKRLPVSGFPLELSFTDSDLMMGGTWPEQVWIQARVDADGVPTTRSDADVESAELGPLPNGAAGVTLVLGG